MEKLLTAKDIQRIFSYGKNQAYSLMHSDGFPTITINERMYVQEEKLIAWLNEHTEKRYLTKK